MKQSKLKACTLFAGAAALLLGMGACNKAETIVSEEPLRVVEHATVRAQVGDRGTATKASLDGDMSSMTLNWAVGDKIVVVSNGIVNGTLTCKSLSGTTGNFEGDISKFTPDAIKLYFLGNQSPNGVNATFDLSRQAGTMNELVGMLFLKTASDVTFVKDEEESASEGSESWKLSGTVSFDPKPMIPILEIQNLDRALISSGLVVPEDSDSSGDYDDDEMNAALLGIKASNVKIEGLQNQLCIDLLNGKVSAGMMPNTNLITVGPSRANDRANSYCLAIIPQNAEDVKMQISYVGAPVSSVMVTGIDWEMLDDDGNLKANHLTTNMAEKGMSVALSFKYGYSGNTIGGGERSDGMNSKGGYGGQTIDGADDEVSSKKGYGGNEVY